jgi:hypothetical protein
MKWFLALCYRFTAISVLLVCGVAMVNDPHNSTVGVSTMAAMFISIFWTLANRTESDKQ